MPEHSPTEPPEDITVPPQSATEVFPRVPRDATRLDARNLYDVGEPTITSGSFDPAVDRVTMRAGVRVSPIGTHTPARGLRYPGGDTRPVDEINRLFDERERAEDRRSGRAAARTAHTVREEAQRRASAKLRHERHLERLETVRAYLTLAIFFVLLVIVTGAGAVGFGIIAGWFTWQPTLNP